MWIYIFIWVCETRNARNQQESYTVLDDGRPFSWSLLRSSTWRVRVKWIKATQSESLLCASVRTLCDLHCHSFIMSEDYSGSVVSMQKSEFLFVTPKQDTFLRRVSFRRFLVHSDLRTNKVCAVWICVVNAKMYTKIYIYAYVHIFWSTDCAKFCKYEELPLSPTSYSPVQGLLTPLQESTIRLRLWTWRDSSKPLTSQLKFDKGEVLLPVLPISHTIPYMKPYVPPKVVSHRRNTK